MKTLMRGFAVATMALILDQASKLTVLRHFSDVPPDARIDAVMPSLNIRLISNRGVTFGLFNNDMGANALVFSVLALIIIGVLIWAMRRTRALHNVAAMGLIIGGALGNLIDRVRLGAVVDFLDFYIGSWHWYVFNVADAAICIGVGILLLDSLLTRAESPK
jgi:signal peptidase II